jgi:hypothetical protein
MCVYVCARVRASERREICWNADEVCSPTQHLNALHVSVHSNHHQAPLLQTFKKKHKYILQYAIFLAASVVQR